MTLSLPVMLKYHNLLLTHTHESDFIRIKLDLNVKSASVSAAPFQANKKKNK